MENLAQKLKELRKKIGYTQEKIANKLKIPRRSYCNYENELKCESIRLYHLIEIIRFYKKIYQERGLNFNVDYLIGLSKNEILEKEIENDYQLPINFFENIGRVSKENINFCQMRLFEKEKIQYVQCIKIVDYCSTFQRNLQKESIKNNIHKKDKDEFLFSEKDTNNKIKKVLIDY